MKLLRLILPVFAILILGNTLQAQTRASDYLKAALAATDHKQYSRAIALCDAAITLNNTYSLAYFHRGYNKVLLNDFQGAIVDFTVCLDLSPDNIRAYLYRGYSHQKSGNNWEASRDYNTARRIDSIETFAFMAGNFFRSSLGN